MERRLTTILSADVAGYSRLMERDEAGTLAELLEVLNQADGSRLMELLEIIDAHDDVEEAQRV